MTDSVLVSVVSGTAWVTLNKPAAFNAINPDVADRLATVLTDFVFQSEVRVIVLTGAGKAFCSGGDLKFFANHAGGLHSGINQTVTPFHRVITSIRRIGKPVVGMLNGVAAGGGFSLAMACDFRVMAKSAVLKFGYPSAGLCPDGGSTYMLPRLLGLSRSLELAAFDEPIDSEKALQLGLVNAVVDDDELENETRAWADRLSRISLSSFGWSKRLFSDSASSTLESQLESERFAILACGQHKDAQEGIASFVEKRPPDFTK